MEMVKMVTTEEVMGTLFKAQANIVEKFAETLVDAATEDSKMVDGEQLDKVFSFGMLLTHCDKCREPHWFVAFAEHGTPLQEAVPKGMVIELVPALNFESAVQTYQAMNNNEVKH